MQSFASYFSLSTDPALSILASNTHRWLNLAQAVELATQEGSRDETFVDHYDGSEESAEEEDFMRDVHVVDRSEESENIFCFIQLVR